MQQIYRSTGKHPCDFHKVAFAGDKTSCTNVESVKDVILKLETETKSLFK